MPAVDLLIRNIGCLATPQGTRPRVAGQMGELPLARDASVWVRSGKFERIVEGGKLPRGIRAAHEIDAGGRLATPGLVDPHTHLLFAGSRHEEFDLRLRGAGYLEMAEKGGGILSTVDAVRRQSEGELVRMAAGRLHRMLSEGTCVVEIKSGYGLDLETELRMLRAIQALKKTTSQELVATFLGAHEIPAEHRRDRAAYVRLLVDEMLPAVTREKLAEYCDVFCERGVFSADEAREILEAAGKSGLGLRIHAEQLSHAGGAALAAELRAASADHLAHLSDGDIEALRGAGTVAVVLPGSALSLGTPRLDYPRRLIQGEVPVAIATDCNPGSSYLESMPLAMALACGLYRLTPAEALTAATLNGACSLGRGRTAGSVEPGKRADLVLWDAEDHREIPYRFGHRLVHRVICGGQVVESAAISSPKSKVQSPKSDATGMLRIWIDGAARGNPGPASAGVVIEDAAGKTLLDEGYLLGATTNNVAEYTALLRALEAAERLGAKTLKIHSDSELLVKQVRGQYKVRHPNLKPLHEQARARLTGFDSVEIVHVRRELNARADAAANRALDG